MSGVVLKYVSVTPEPKRPRGMSDVSGRTTSPQGPAELLEACKTLGIRPTDLQSRVKGEFVDGGTGKMDEQAWKVYETARLQKLRIVQREVLRRRSLHSGVSKPRLRPRALPVLPAAVSLFSHRLEDTNAKVFLTKPFERKFANERKKTQHELALQTEALNRQREEILRKIRGLEERRQKCSSHSLRRGRQEEKYVSMRSMISGQSQVSEWDAACERDLEAICSQLAALEGAKPKALGPRKETMRGRLDSLKTIREEKGQSDGEREGKRRKVLISETPSYRAPDLGSVEALPKVRQVAASPTPSLPEKAGLQPKYDPGEEYISLLNEYTGNDQDRILMKWRKAERSLSEIQARQDHARLAPDLKKL